MADPHQIITLFVFFLGAALCFWRVPQASVWNVVLRVMALALWCGLLLFEPRTRTPMFGVATITFLISGLSHAFRRTLNRE